MSDVVGGEKFRKRWPFLQPDVSTIQKISDAMPQYLFYEPEGRKGKRLCKCSKCEQSGVYKTEGKHGDTVQCPMCGEEVILKASNRLTNEAPSLRSHRSVMYFTAHGEYLYAVGADAIKYFERNSWCGPDWNSDIDITPYEVYRFRPGEAVEWRYKGYLAGLQYRYDWLNTARPSEPNLSWFGEEVHYQVFDTEEIGRSSVKHCAIELYKEPMEDGGYEYGVIRYLTAYCRHPKLELVVKWGLLDVATDLVERRRNNGHYVNWGADTPWAFLKISKADWRIYRGSGVGTLKLLKANRKFKMTMAELMDAVNALGDPENWLEKALQLHSRGIPLRQQIRYIQKQGAERRPISYIFRIWLDYLNMAEQCGWDVSITGGAMPRNLQQAHDDMVEVRRTMREEIEVMELEKKQTEYKKRKDKLEKKYAYQSGELMIKVPASGNEIIQEGNVLHICVGGYAARHIEGKTTILFLRRRRKPDTPYICIEIQEKDNRIMQIHGYRNEALGHGKRITPPRERFRAFLDEWLAWVNAGSKRTEKKIKEDATA